MKVRKPYIKYLVLLLFVSNLAYGGWSRPFYLKFNGDLKNFGTLGNEVIFKWKQEPDFVTGFKGQAAQFSRINSYSGNFVTAQLGSHIPQEMKGFRASFDLRLTDSNKKLTSPLWLNGLFGITVSNRKLTLVVFTDTKRAVRLNAPDKNILRVRNWYNIVVGVDSAKSSMYLMLDGEVIAEGKINGPLSSSAKSSLTIGSDPWNRVFPGEMDNFSLDIEE